MYYKLERSNESGGLLGEKTVKLSDVVKFVTDFHKYKGSKLTIECMEDEPMNIAENN